MVTATQAAGLALQTRRKLGCAPRMHRQLRIVAGIDSLTEGGGTVSSTYRTPLLPLIRREFGDCGPGLMRFNGGDVNDALSHTTYNVANSITNTSFYVGGTGVSQITALAWSNAIRQKSLFGGGVYSTGATAGFCGFAITPSSIPNIIGFRIIFEFTAAGSSFRWRQNSATETGSTATSVASDSGVGVNGGSFGGGAFTLNKLYSIVRPYYAGRGTAEIAIDLMVGDIRIYAVEAITSVPGATLMNLGLGGTKASDWAQLDDTRTREFVNILQPDLSIINAGMNDRSTDKDALFALNLDTIAGRFQAYGPNNVLLVRPNDASDTASTNLVNYTPVIVSVASTRRCGWIDDRSALGDYTAAISAGFMDGIDVIHPTLTGNTARTNAYFRRIVDYTSGAAYLA